MSFDSSKSISLPQEEVEKVLLFVEGINPVGSQLDQVGPYGIQQIRQAIAQKAMECVRPKSDGLFSLVYRGEKQLADGSSAKLRVMYPKEASEADRDCHLPKTVELSIIRQGKYVLEFEYPTIEPGDELDLGVCFRFSDFRQNPQRFTFLSDMRKKGANPHQVRHMLEGMRWLAANLRLWRDLPDSIVLPEDV